MPAGHLYIHVPFCARRCAYCDFSIAVRREPPVREYLAALRTELSIRSGHHGAESPSNHDTRVFPRASLPFGSRLETLYFGGGTPSRLGAGGMRDLVDLVRDYYELEPNAEVTVEANPEDVTSDTIEAWVGAGINRLSLGVQTFDDSVLEWMHRTHSASHARNAFAQARQGGFSNISVDLIFAVPAKLGRSWHRDIGQVLALEPDHISLYGLTAEPATPLSRWMSRGLVEPMPDDSYADEFLFAHDSATDAGFTHYEVSNFAKPGRVSRHNSAYWTESPYMGAGPSSHSFDGSSRSWNVAPYAEWVSRLAGGGGATDGVEKLTPANRVTEKIYLGLRTTKGLAFAGRDLETVCRWSAEGWATIGGSMVRLTPEGWLRLDALAAGLTGL